MDMKIDGKLRGIKHPVWATYRHLIKNANVFLNGNISIPEAEELLSDGTGDVIIFGRPWITNPDFANKAIAGLECIFEYDFSVSCPKTQLQRYINNCRALRPTLQIIRRRVTQTFPSPRLITTLQRLQDLDCDRGAKEMHYYLDSTPAS